MINKELEVLNGEDSKVGVVNSSRANGAGRVWKLEGIMGKKEDGNQTQSSLEVTLDNGGRTKCKKT